MTAPHSEILVSDATQPRGFAPLRSYREYPVQEMLAAIATFR